MAKGGKSVQHTRPVGNRCALGRMGRETDDKLKERRTEDGNGILSEVLETDSPRRISCMGNHRGNLLFSAGTSCLACRS